MSDIILVRLKGNGKNQRIRHQDFRESLHEYLPDEIKSIEEEVKETDEAPSDRFEELKEKGWKNLNSGEKKEYQKLKSNLTK